MTATATPFRDGRTLTSSHVWAGIGTVILAFEGYNFVRWILTGQASRTPAGVDSIPTSMVVTARIAEVVSVAISVAIVRHYLIRPWRREGRATLDGLLILVCTTLFWLDPLFIATRPWSNYNAAFVNLGSWAHIPGVANDNANLFGEPLLFASGLYIAMVFGGMAVGCWFMDRVSTHFPTWRRWQVALSGLAFLAILDIILEGLVFVRLGLYVFPGGFGPMINGGRYFQFPLIYAGHVIVTWWAWACIRYFRNDRGQTIADAAIDSAGPADRRTAITRFLALAGVFHLSGLLLFVVPMNVLSLNANAWPEDFDGRSYLHGGLCADDTPCPLESHDDGAP